MKWFKRSKDQSAKAKEERRILRVSDFLAEKNIAILPQGPSKQQVFGTLLASFDLPDPSAALKSLLAREEVGSTVISPGIALPHARLPGISRIHAALGICPAGVLDPRAGGDSIRLFLLFLGPADNMREHLAFLASVSSLLQADGIAESLVSADSPKTVLARIRAAESKLS